jgi:mycoredoxin
MTTAPVTVYGTSWFPDCRRATRVLEEQNVAYHSTNIEEDAAAAAYVVQINAGNRSVPTIVFPDGSVLVEPSSRMLQQKLISV